jgi:hypothetical protein
MPTRLLSIFALALALGACADERPDQRLAQSEEAAEQRDQRPMEDARRQRTLGQNEAERIYGGGLR